MQRDDPPCFLDECIEFARLRDYYPNSLQVVGRGCANVSIFRLFERAQSASADIARLHRSIICAKSAISVAYILYCVCDAVLSDTYAPNVNGPSF